MVERVQNKILWRRKCRISLLNHILEVLKDVRQIFLQKLLDTEGSGDDTSSVELGTKPRICALQDSQDPYDLWQNKNKDKRKEPVKVTTIDKNKGRYLNEIFILQVKTKLSTGTIHHSPPNIALFSYSLDKELFMNSTYK